MPIVDIKILEGRDTAIKRKLIEAVTDSVEQVLCADRKSIRVLLHEIPAAHWGVAGEPLSIRNEISVDSTSHAGEAETVDDA